MKEAQIFESWINNLVEGTWTLPETPEQQEKLKMLMSEPLVAGADGMNATEQLYDVVGDDQLFDAIVEVAEKNPDANIWEDKGVQRRLEELGIYVVTPTDGDEVAPVPNTQDTGVPDGGTIAPQGTVPPVQEDVEEIEESLRRMLNLAQVPVSEAVLKDDTGNTWDHLLNNFRHEVEQFKAGGELDNDLYDALYDYYNDHGAMPRGTAKGRTGDPFEWVTQRFADDLGLNEGDNMATFVEAPLDEFIGMAAVGEGTCNATMEGEYCPEHGLAECGGMYETGTTAGGMAPVMGEGDQQAFVNKHHDDAINYNAAVTGSYYESDELARLKSLALGEAVIVNPSTTIMNPDTEKMVNPDWEKHNTFTTQDAIADKIKYGGAAGAALGAATQKSGLAAKSGDVIDVDAKEVSEDDIPDEFISNKTTGPTYNDVQRYADYTKDMKQNFGPNWKPTPGVAKPYDTAKLGTPQTTQSPVSVHEDDSVLARIKSLALLK